VFNFLVSGYTVKYKIKNPLILHIRGYVHLNPDILIKISLYRALPFYIQKLFSLLKDEVLTTKPAETKFNKSKVI